MTIPQRLWFILLFGGLLAPQVAQSETTPQCAVGAAALEHALTVQHDEPLVVSAAGNPHLPVRSGEIF